MKALVLVPGIDCVPTQHRKSILVVNQLNWQETFHFLEGKVSDVYIYVHENCPVERLLKLIEEYKGNMAVYTSQLVSPVLLSRFTKVVNRRKPEIDTNFGKESDEAVKLKKLKAILI